MNIKIEAKSNVWKVKANIKKTWKNSSNLIQKLPHLSNLPIALTRVSHSLLYTSSNLIHFFQYQFCLNLNFLFLKDFFVLVYLFYLFILVGDFVVVFVIHWYESAMNQPWVYISWSFLVVLFAYHLMELLTLFCSSHTSLRRTPCCRCLMLLPLFFHLLVQNC